MQDLKTGRVAIIGTGISGLTCASLLVDRGLTPILFEKNSFVGGLISCSNEKGNLFHKTGGHVFGSKHKIVNDWFWSKFDRDEEFLKSTRNAVIYLDNNFINYPIENNLHQIDESLVSNIVIEIAKIITDGDELSKDISSYANLKELFIARLGKTLYDLYFKPYNEKIWQRELKDIKTQWLGGKFPMIDPVEILKNNILNLNKDSMPHSTFYYPKSFGSQFIVDRLSQDLTIITNCNINTIEFTDSDKGIYLNGERFEYLIYTGDVRDLIKLPSIRNLLSSQNSSLTNIRQLESNGTTTVLCECDENPYSWVYLPSPDCRAHRIIMTGNFSQFNNSTAPNKISCTVEFSGTISDEAVNNSIQALPFNTNRLGPINRAKNSYVIDNTDCRHHINKIQKELNKKNIWLCGRFAEWQYYNMDNCMLSAMRTCEDIFAKL